MEEWGCGGNNCGDAISHVDEMRQGMLDRGTWGGDADWVGLQWGQVCVSRDSIPSVKKVLFLASILPN